MEILIASIISSTCFAFAAGRASKSVFIGTYVGVGVFTFITVLKMIAKFGVA